MKIFKGEFSEKLDLLIAPQIKAGFPSPAEDYLHESLDFNRDLIKHPEATFYGRVDGDSMEGAGICDGDIAVIDRINKVNGSETVILGSQQYTQKDGKGKAAIEREQSQAGLNSAERKQSRPKVKAEVFANAIKHDYRSKNPTTRWSDIIRLK